MFLGGGAALVVVGVAATRLESRSRQDDRAVSLSAVVGGALGGMVVGGVGVGGLLVTNLIGLDGVMAPLAVAGAVSGGLIGAWKMRWSRMLIWLAWGLLGAWLIGGVLLPAVVPARYYDPALALVALLGAVAGAVLAERCGPIGSKSESRSRNH